MREACNAGGDARKQAPAARPPQGRPRRHGGLLVLQRIVVWGGDEQKVQWDLPHGRPVSRSLVP